MPNFDELRAMYDRGETEAVLTETEKNPVSPGSENIDDITTLKGWCHYRRKEFDQAYECAVAAGSHQWARELMAYLHAYVPKYKDDEALKQIADELGSSNINVANALLIRARAEDCSLLTARDVDKLTGTFAAFSHGVNGANLWHNAGRWYLAKWTIGSDDYRHAWNCISGAIARYGTEANFHHRAAAHFWWSQASEKMGDSQRALEEMHESVRLWIQQCRLDPTNRGFAQSSENAAKRLEELMRKKA